MDEETVRLRIKRMQERGFIRSFDAVPNPGALGCELVRLQGRPVPLDRRPAAAEALAAVDGAHLVFQHYSGALSLVAYAPRDRPRDRLAALFGAVAGEPVSVTSFRVPDPEIELDAADWRIVAALRPNARAPLVEVAARAGLSERTVRRRLERLVTARALMLDPDIDFTRMEGALPAMVTVRAPSAEARRRVGERLAAVPDLLFRVEAGDEARASFLARSIASVDALRADLARLEGVEAVFGELYVERRACRAWVDEEIQRRASVPVRAD